MRDIVITIDADRRAAAPRNVGIICDNSDVRISFSIATGSGFNTAEPIFAIFVTDRGELPAVSFTGGSVIAPVFGAEDGAYVRIGLCQGEIKTSSPATLHLLGSAHSVAHGASADPHADEYNRIISEISEEDKFILERASDGYRGAATIAALLELLSEGADGEDGASAYEIAVAHGFSGPEAEWLASLKGDTGDSGSFVCIYDVTTWAEFVAAVQAGKSIKVRDGTSYGWADIIDIENEYASFFIIGGEDGATAWCEFGNGNGVNEWSAWHSDSFVLNSSLQSALPPAKLGNGYAVCSTAAATAAKTASLSSYELTAGGVVAIKFANAVGANATLNINEKGAKAIYFRGAAITADVIKAGDTVTMMYSTYYHVLSIDRWGTDIATMQTTLNGLVVADNVGY